LPDSADIDRLRNEQHRQWRNTQHGRERVYTVADLAAMKDKDQQARANFGGVAAAGRGSLVEYALIILLLSQIACLTSSWFCRLGKEMLKYTNEFRAKHGLPALIWHQVITFRVAN
jgi:uncharacterized protein YkwD